VKLYAIHHDRTRPEVCGPLANVTDRCAMILVNGVRKRVALDNVRPGSWNPAFNWNKGMIAYRMAKKRSGGN